MYNISPLLGHKHKTLRSFCQNMPGKAIYASYFGLDFQYGRSQKTRAANDGTNINMIDQSAGHYTAAA